MFYGLATNKVRVPGYVHPHPLRHRDPESPRPGRGLLRRHRHQLSRLSLRAAELHADGLRRQRGRGLRAHGRLHAPASLTTTWAASASPCPDTLTTAYLALKIFNPEIETETVPFDQIIPAILAGKYDAGLIIHEGQLTYYTSGLYRVLDLGVWWRETTGLVLPLGGNAIRRSLGAEQHRDHLQGVARQHPARARPPRTGARIRHAVCPRPGLHAWPTAL